MEDRQAEQAKFLKIFGEWPLDLIDQTNPGLRRKEFETALRDYLGRQQFSRTLSNKLVAKLFRMTCFFLRRKKALPRMMAIVNSHEWKERASELKRLHTVEIPRMIQRVLGQSKASQSREEETLSAKLRTWTVRQLRALEDALLWVYQVQNADASEVRHLSHPPIDSQFFWELREFLKDNMRKASMAEIDIVVAGCGVAAHIFSSDDVALDVVSRIPMRISRAKETFNKQFNRSRDMTTLTYQPQPALPIVLPEEIVVPAKVGRQARARNAAPRSANESSVGAHKKPDNSE